MKNRKMFIKFASLFTTILMVLSYLFSASSIYADGEKPSFKDEKINKNNEIIWEKDDFFTTNNGKTLGGRVDIQTPEGTNNVEMSGFSAKGKEKLKKNHHVVIPEGIEIIDSVAFNRPNQTPDDEYIESVTFPSTLKKIGYGAFFSQKIKGTLEIPEGVTQISPGAFSSNQIEKVILPSTLVNDDWHGISNRAFQNNKIREVVLKQNFKNVKFQIDGNDNNYMSAGPFDNQNLGEITASVGSEFKIPFVINQIGESDIQSIGGFMINGTPTKIEDCDFLTKKDGKYIITKAGKYPAQFIFYDSHGRTFRPQFGRTRPVASINFTYNIVQKNTVTFMDDDKVIKKVEVENGKNIDSDNITEDKGQMPKNPTKAGYVFKEWNTQADGKGTAFTGETTVNGDMTVYAIYDKKIVTINEDPILEVKDKTITKGEDLDLMSLVVKATDKEDGNLIDKVKIVDDGGFDKDKVGEYTVTFEVKDSKGATVKAKAKVTVKEKVVNPDPQKPVNPSDNPDPSDNPEKPEDPSDNPEKPVNPDPQKPEEPSDNPKKPIANTKLPETGDNSNLFIYGIVLGLSGLVFAITGYFRKKYAK